MNHKNRILQSATSGRLFITWAHRRRRRQADTTAQRRISKNSGAATLLVLFALLGAALPMILLLGGCEAIGAGIQVLDDEKKVTIPAEYRGLDGKKFAVLIDAPMDIQFGFPRAVPYLTGLITAGISQDCTGSKPLPAEYVVSFQQNNVYWPTMDMQQIAKALNVDRLVLVDLQEYRLMAPGNSYIWDGKIEADISVYEAESLDPTSPAYKSHLKAEFPTVSGVTTREASAASVEQGLQILFAQNTVKLFHDVERKKGDIRDEQLKARHKY